MIQNDSLIKLVPTLLEGLALFYLAGHIFAAKVSRARRYLANVCFYLLDFCIVFLFQDGPYIPFIKIAMICLLIVAWARYVYRVPILNGIFLAIFQYSYWAVTDLLFVSIASLIWGELTNMLQNHYLPYLVIKTAELVLIVVFCHIFRRRQDISWQSSMRMLAFPVCILGVVFYLASIAVESPLYAARLLNCILFLLIADIGSIYLLGYLEELQSRAEFDRSFRQNLQMVHQNVDSWKDAYLEQRSYTHDFQNKLAVLQGLANQAGTPAELQAYLDELLQNQPSCAYCLDTHRPVADVLLSQKQALAKSCGIRMKMNLDDLSAFPLSDDELVIVFSNLLDNAVEACRKIPDSQQRWIHFKAKVEGSTGYLYVENSTQEPVKIIDNRIVASRRHDSQLHGFGLKNVLYVLNQNHGVYHLSYHEDTHSFRFAAQI